METKTTPPHLPAHDHECQCITEDLKQLQHYKNAIMVYPNNYQHTTDSSRQVFLL